MPPRHSCPHERSHVRSEQQVSPLSCPSGFYCATPSLQAPVLCPVGFICNATVRFFFFSLISKSAKNIPRDARGVRYCHEIQSTMVFCRPSSTHRSCPCSETHDFTALDNRPRTKLLPPSPQDLITPVTCNPGQYVTKYYATACATYVSRLFCC